MENFRISRNTARNALDLLVRLGLAHRVQGRGTFVAGPRMRYGLFYLSSFTEEARRHGWEPHARVLRLTRQPASPDIAHELQLLPGEPVVCLERLRFVDNRPIALHLVFLPERLVPGLLEEDFSQSSLYEILESRYQLRLWYSEQTIRAAAASPDQAAALGVPVGAPLLFIRGVTYLEDRTPVESMRLFYRGDAYEICFTALRYPLQPLGD